MPPLNCNNRIGTILLALVLSKIFYNDLYLIMFCTGIVIAANIIDIIDKKIDQYRYNARTKPQRDAETKYNEELNRLITIRVAANTAWTLAKENLTKSINIRDTSIAKCGLCMHVGCNEPCDECSNALFYEEVIKTDEVSCKLLYNLYDSAVHGELIFRRYQCPDK
jgi:hypothetical protein